MTLIELALRRSDRAATGKHPLPRPKVSEESWLEAFLNRLIAWLQKRPPLVRIGLPAVVSWIPVYFVFQFIRSLP